MHRNIKSIIAALSVIAVASVTGVLSLQAKAAFIEQPVPQTEHAATETMLPPLGGSGQDPINEFLNCLAGCDATRDAALNAAYATRDAERAAAHAKRDADYLDSKNLHHQALLNCLGSEDIACIHLENLIFKTRNENIEAALLSELQAANQKAVTAILNAHDAWETCVQGCVDTLAAALASS